MKKLLYISILGYLMSSCTADIKNTEASVEVEAGTAVELSDSAKNAASTENKTKTATLTTSSILGFWVGYFERDSKDDSNVYVDEGYYWDRANKINISIDSIKDTLVIGHSVVAGNDRPFKGTVTEESNGSLSFKVKEPGDDKYDGAFTFTIHQDKLNGKWTAYKNIEVKKRAYELEKKQFSYDSGQMLERAKRYIDWNKVIERKEVEEYDDNEFEEWIYREFAAATDLIYEMNASSTLLTKSEVENLKKGDLTIIRNTIYARHGYSFKNRPLRIFFDAQKWYIPVHADIKGNFTEVEKKNIQLLLKYEKNAAEYYDSFGRG